ncbi:hypothetical protein BDB01DRAFT_778705 [Pilobolus umbonatus]|nr:hypothetical protein BDB01DRAFT_778705 [Pilobolus umbonatus]
MASIHSKESNITLPAPILRPHSYPTAPVLLVSPNTISTPALHLQMRSNISIESGNNPIYTVLSYNNADILYYNQLTLSLLNPSTTEETDERQSKVDLFFLLDALKNPVGELSHKDWHGIQFNLLKGNMGTSLSTSPPHFSFTWNKTSLYQWQVVTLSANDYMLQLYNKETKKLVSEFRETEITIESTMDGYNTNPFRMSQKEPLDDPFTTLIISTGLLIQSHVKMLLKSLGGGPDALQMLIDPSNTPIKYPTDTKYEDDDILGIHSYQYRGKHGLVESTRWSTPSFTSIKLDTSIWNCWWGYDFWWTWLPCCMPGGYCDRLCIKLNGQSTITSKRTLSKQGWTQQNY